MTKHGNWTPEEVVSSFLRGETITHLSKRVGGSYHTIHKVLEDRLGKDQFQVIRDKNDPKCGTWTKEEALSAFLAGETFIALCKRLGGSPNTIRQVLKDQLGEEKFKAIRDKNDPKKSTASEEEVLTPFHTDEPMKEVAARLNMSPNTLRDRWVAAFGKETFDARSKKFHSAAGTRVGLAWKGKKRVSEETIQARDVTRGVDRRCPICNVGCVGYQALVNHLSRFGDEKHISALEALRKQELGKKWEGLEEGRDYVTCAVCGFKGESLNNHIKLHGLTAEMYQNKYGISICSEILHRKRSEILSESLSQHLFSREDLLKYADSDGNVIIASASLATGHVGSTIIGYCRKYGLPTRNKLAWQKVVLDKAAAFLGSDYIWEWSDSRITNPKTGWKFNFDGFFPKHNLILEAHGQQHYQYSELWHGVIEEFERQRELDSLKEKIVVELGYRYKVVRFTDPIESSIFWTSLLRDEKELWSNKTEEEKTVFVKTIFQVVRRHGWPEPEPSPQTKAELTRLQNTKVYLEGDLIRPYSIVGAYAAGTFFPNRYHAKRQNGLNAWEMWHDDRSLRKAIRLQLDSGHPTTPERILKAVVMFSRTPSVFRPAVAKYVYENYCPKGGTVWDPCAGYGGRLMAAMASGIKLYLGTDIEPMTVNGNIKLASFLGVTSRCKLEIADAVLFEPNIALDLIFTSPPYYDLENYGEVFNRSVQKYGSVNSWIERFLHPLIQHSHNFLHFGGHLALNLPWRLVGGLRLDQAAIDIANLVGFKLLKTIYMPVRSISGNKREPILVWQKV